MLLDVLLAVIFSYEFVYHNDVLCLRINVYALSLLYLETERIKTMPRTNFGKTRSHDKPYAIYSDGRGWEWRVLKTYKHSSAEKNDGYARWYVSATSPMMHGGLVMSMEIPIVER